MAPLVNPWQRGAMIDVAARELALALRETRTAAILRQQTNNLHA